MNGSTFATAGFKFTSANEAVTATNASLTIGDSSTSPKLAGDTLVDATTTDNDALNLTLSATLDMSSTPTISISGIETLNITETALSILTLANVTGLKTINVLGASGALEVIGGAAAGATTINASGVTDAAGTVKATLATATKATTLIGGAGADELTGGTAGGTLTGGAGADKLNATSGANTITGGLGGDTIKLGTGTDTVVIGAGESTTLSLTSMDQIGVAATASTLFATGVDHLKLGMTVAAGDFGYATESTSDSAVASMAELLTAANASGKIAVLVTDKATASPNAYNSFLFVSTDGNLTNGYEIAVELVGLTSSGFVATDIYA